MGSEVNQGRGRGRGGWRSGVWVEVWLTKLALGLDAGSRQRGFRRADGVRPEELGGWCPVLEREDERGPQRPLWPYCGREVWTPCWARCQGLLRLRPQGTWDWAAYMAGVHHSQFWRLDIQVRGACPCRVGDRLSLRPHGSVPVSPANFPSRACWIGHPRDFCEGPVSKYTCILGYRGLGHQFGGTDQPLTT